MVESTLLTITAKHFFVASSQYVSPYTAMSFAHLQAPRPTPFARAENLFNRQRSFLAKHCGVLLCPVHVIWPEVAKVAFPGQRLFGEGVADRATEWMRTQLGRNAAIRC